MSKSIKIWKYEDCPKYLFRYITNKDDIDYIAFIPNELRENYFGFLDSESFGCCVIEEYKIPKGILKVGHHA